MDSIFNQKLLDIPVERDSALCGVDIEYTPAFTSFLTLATGREERQIGENIIPAQEPDWNTVFKTGCKLLEESRDLRVLAIVSRAAIHQYGIPGLAQSLSLTVRWLEGHWEDVHPRLYIDDDYDPLFRSNAIASLSDSQGLVRSLRQTAFIETPIGAITVSQAERLLNGKPVGDEQSIVTSTEQLTRILVEEQSRNRENLEALSVIHEAIDSISSVFKQHLDSEYWPDLETLTDITMKLHRFVTTNLQDGTAQPVETSAETLQHQDAEQPLSSQQPLSRPASIGLPASLTSRAEAFKALSIARKYFEDHEPSHPAPLLIKRVERLADMDFFSIVKDLTPEGLQQLQLLTGSTNEGGH